VAYLKLPFFKLSPSERVSFEKVCLQRMRVYKKWICWGAYWLTVALTPERTLCKILNVLLNAFLLGPLSKRISKLAAWAAGNSN